MTRGYSLSRLFERHHRSCVAEYLAGKANRVRTAWQASTMDTKRFSCVPMKIAWPRRSVVTLRIQTSDEVVTDESRRRRLQVREPGTWSESDQEDN